MKIDFEVLYYISSENNSNIRNIKGGLTRVMAYAKIHSEEITMDLAKKVLGEPRDMGIANIWPQYSVEGTKQGLPKI